MHARYVSAAISASSAAFAYLVLPVSVRTAGICGSPTAVAVLKFRLQCTLSTQFDPAVFLLDSFDSREAHLSSPSKSEDSSGGVLAIPRHDRKAARRTRSFRRRQAPITRGQRQKMRELWPHHGLPMDYKQRLVGG